MNFLCSWSGGKDSCYAFYKATKLGFKPAVLLNVMNEFGDRSRSHGIPKLVLEAQAEALQLPIHFFSSTWTDYEVKYIENLQRIVKDYPISHAVFGDIDIESHRAWEEKVSAAANLEAVLPLWQGNRKQLVLEMIEAGIEAVIVSCNQELGPDYLGRTITAELVEELENKGVDACGENGEFHTLVINAPFFKHKVDVEITEKAVSSNYNFAVLELKK
ncbi:diphthine--ammonia ligase [Tamlana sp. 2_MG-2023]|uniref:Dph6-related ATP pyrophosphatase n=1 Tax=unclassified Tamlana TaxID=2614803 RepID=UPI0026E25341|nr:MULTISPECIES: diphthine--ammonia ligase [unclassified Tamlana]MDO6760051.1 diphthine--ammonia ligase [Tamlana sp. 2_MG-2023]MDO6790251.1 diphthine--ammonia ligase [Tamlana sp. 1_MG-2023]